MAKLKKSNSRRRYVFRPDEVEGEFSEGVNSSSAYDNFILYVVSENFRSVGLILFYFLPLNIMPRFELSVYLFRPCIPKLSRLQP